MHANPFRKIDSGDDGKSGESNATGELSSKEKDWGKVKFNPVANPGTPWATFKREIPQFESDQHQLNLDNNDAQQCLKVREERKLRIAGKQMEKVKWEDDFGECGQESKQTDIPEMMIKSKSKRKARRGNTSHKPFAIINQEQLKSFDSKTLSFRQNNILRKLITRNTCLARGQMLNFAVEDLKQCGIQKPKNL